MYIYIYTYMYTYLYKYFCSKSLLAAFRSEWVLALARYSSPSQRGKKGKKKNCFFLNGVLMRPFATPLSANMMPSFRESSRGHQKFQYPPKKLKHLKNLRNGENTKYKNPYNRLPTGSFWASWGATRVKITCPTRW